MQPQNSHARSTVKRCHKYISHRKFKQYIPELCHKHTEVWLFSEAGSVFCIRVKIHNLKQQHAGWSHYNSILSQAILVKRVFVELSGRYVLLGHYLRRQFALPAVRLLVLRAGFARLLISSEGLLKSLRPCFCKHANFDNHKRFVKFYIRDFYKDCRGISLLI